MQDLTEDRGAAVIGVVIPCRNAAATLGAQLAALQREDLPVPAEIIVADNGSTDDTRKVAERFATGRIPVVVADASARPGINHARNAGVRASSAKFVVLCDADDVIEPGWLEAMWNAMRNGAQLVGGSLVRVGPDGSPIGPPTSAPHDYLAFLPWPTGANCGFTRAIYDSLGGFDEAYRGGGDEVDFFWQAQLAGAALTFVSDARVRYQERETLARRWRQQRAYGFSHVVLYVRFRAHGMPRSSTRVAVRFWAKLPYRSAVAILRPEKRPLLVSWIAQRIGRLHGSVVMRTWYP